MKVIIIFVVFSIFLESLEGSPVDFKLESPDHQLQSILSSARIDPDFSLKTDANLTVPEIIDKYGYPIEIHSVTTEDGYILELHRIPFGKKCPADQGSDGPGSAKRVIFVQHGLLCDSSNFVISGVEKGLAYLLADACYDVFLGNARGNTYSRKHKTLDPDLPADKAAYWGFSWNEMGIYDVPANIDYVLNQTGVEKIYYIGHSMGTTMFFVAMSERPEYNDKIALMSAFAPVAYTEHMISPIRFIAPYSSQIEWLLEMFGLYEFLPSTKFMELVGQTVCKEDNPFHAICSNILFLLCGFDPDQLDEALIPELLGHLPAGASVQSLVHYAQGVTSTEFRKFDYGAERNLIEYGQAEPPLYNWSNITAPIALYWAENDWLGARADSLRIAANVKNLQSFYRINHDKFNHLDFLFAKDAVPLVYTPAIQFMKDF